MKTEIFVYLRALLTNNCCFVNLLFTSVANVIKVYKVLWRHYNCDVFGSILLQHHKLTFLMMS